MKFKKFMAGTAAVAVAIGSLTTYASANCIYDPTFDGETLDEGCSADSSYLIQLYNTGNPSENKPARDYGVDPLKLAKMEFYTTFHISPDPEFGIYDWDEFDPELDAFGGGVIYSSNGGGLIGTSNGSSEMYDEMTTYFGKFNWPSLGQWWGLPEEGDSAEGDYTTGDGTNQGNVDYTQDACWEWVADKTYHMAVEVPEDMRWEVPTSAVDEENGATCFQIGLQTWGGSGAFCLKVELFVLYDDDDNIMLVFDSCGNTLDEDEYEAALADIKAGNRSPSNTEGSNNTDSDEDSSSDDSSDTSANEENSTASDDSDNSAETTTSAESNSNSESNNDNTATIVIIIIAAVVVIAVIVIIVVVSKKKKNS